MTQLSTRTQWLIGLSLAMLMVATRGQNALLASFHNVIDATWAIFFIAGFYLRSNWSFPVLLGLAGVLDYISITHMGTSSFCVSAAYPLLILAYGALWTAGRWYAGKHTMELRSLLPLSASLFIGAFACELISSGGFYFFSGNFAEPTFAEFALRIGKYFPSYLQGVIFYAGIAAAIHILFSIATDKGNKIAILK